MVLATVAYGRLGKKNNLIHKGVTLLLANKRADVLLNEF